MGLFKNEVGRPSNETLKKRRLVATIMIFAVVLAVGACVFYTVNYFKTVGSNKNISTGSIYTNISVRNNSSYIYVGNEKTKKGDFKVFSNNKLEIDLNFAQKASITVRTTYDSAKTYGVKVGNKKYYYQVQTMVYDKNDKVLDESKITTIKKTTINQTVNVNSSATYIMVRFYDATSSHNQITYVKIPIRVAQVTNLEKVIPDSGLRLCILSYYANYNNYTNIEDLSENQLKKITGKSNMNTSKKGLDCTNKGIKDTTGLNKLTNLVQIYLDKNKITKLDISKNTKLEYLYVNANKITNIDVSKNTKLKELDLGDNELTSLNVRNNTNLKLLKVSNNDLTEIDVSKNINLETLDVGLNQLPKISVSTNQKLVTLNVGYNGLWDLDLTNNKNLKVLRAVKNNLHSLDLSKNTKLEELYLNNNGFTSLNVSKNTKLRKLEILTGNKIEKYRIDGGRNKKVVIR